MEPELSNEWCILTSDLTKRFGGRVAVDRLNLSVAKGQSFGFLGPNGAGKSTTIRMLLGLIRPGSGEIRVLGHDISTDRLKALAGVGAMVESPSFYPYMTGRENVKLFAELSGPITDAQIDRALDAVGLLQRSADKVRAYSHGMKQRLGLACAIVSEPDLVILDEPTNGLDPKGVMDVRSLIRSLTQERGMTVFLSSHLLYEVEQVCSHVAVIAGGKILTSGSVEQLLARKYGPVEFEVDFPETASELVWKQFGDQTIWASQTRFAVNAEMGRIAEINELLVNKGLRVTAIEPKRQSLEEFYLELMGQNGHIL